MNEMHQSHLEPEANKFHVGNGSDGKHYWLTPPALRIHHAPGPQEGAYGLTFDCSSVNCCSAFNLVAFRLARA